MKVKIFVNNHKMTFLGCIKIIMLKVHVIVHYRTVMLNVQVHFYFYSARNLFGTRLTLSEDDWA